MKPLLMKLAAIVAAAAVLSAGVLAWFPPPPSESPPAAEPASGVLQPGMVNCGNLIYGNNKTSKCFSPDFLSQIGRETNVVSNPNLVPVNLESSDLFNFPFCVMTGEGAWSLTDAQRENMRNYLQAGGFIIASAGCSDENWQRSFRQEIARVFPELQLSNLDMSHPVFHTVYEIKQLQCKNHSSAHLEGLEIDGKIVLIFSPDGLNDTGNAGGSCCCCGGDEIRNARQVNVNLLAYTLTH